MLIYSPCSALLGYGTFTWAKSHDEVWLSPVILLSILTHIAPPVPKQQSWTHGKVGGKPGGASLDGMDK